MSRSRRMLSIAAILSAVYTLAIWCQFQSGASAQSPTKASNSPSSIDSKTTPARELLQNAEVTAEGGINFYIMQGGKRQRVFAISPNGSLIAGGVSRAGTPKTDTPPVIDPTEYDKAGAHSGRDWIHDFYFGRFEFGEGQPRLYSRGMFLWGRGDSPDIQLGRTGPDNPTTTYGAQQDTAPGASLGKIVFLNWGAGQFQGDLATITARNETVATNTKNPGSLHFMTAGASVMSEPKQVAQAWRDGIDRMVIQSNGYVGIGDGFANPEERLHVKGNIRAEGNIQATGDIVAQGAKKFEIEHPTQPGKHLAHAALEGPESAVYYRGKGRLNNGCAVIHLPEYFEVLTRKEGRTITLTNIDGFDRLAVQSQEGCAVKDGSFSVVCEEWLSAQRFFWEVKAVRADIRPLQVER